MTREFYDDLYGLMKNAFREMQELVFQSKENKKFIFTQYQFPKLGQMRMNGMPSLSEYFFTDAPKDYSSVFKKIDDDKSYNFNRINSIQKIRELFVNNIDELNKHPFFEDCTTEKRLWDYCVSSMVLTAFDCYMHESNDANGTSFDEIAFKKIVMQLFNRFFLDDLPISICVPILMVRFKEDSIEVSDNIKIRKMTDRELISAYKIGAYSDTQELSVVTCATHILELSNYKIHNSSFFSWFPLEHKEAYPIHIIDKWFAAFRIITHIQSGYGQVLAFPDDWGVRNGNLLSIFGDKIKNFNFEFITQAKWNDPTPLLSKENLESVNRLFEFFLNTPNNSLNIAIKRLNRAYTRESEEDAILDLVIAIEALLTDNDHGEITYKVSTRAAWVLSELPMYPYTLIETKRIIAKLYAFRSNIVHGTTQIDKSRIIKIRDGIDKESIPLAIEILQYLILAISHNPRLLNTKELDAYFLDNYAALLRVKSVDYV